MENWILLAEVMDKEPALSEIWQWAIVGAVLGFCLCRLVPWLVVVVLPVAALFPFAVCTEIWSFDVGPCIVEEAGWSYVVQSYLALGVTIMGPVAGTAAWLMRLRSNAIAKPALREV